jgi:hypothetical protein
MCDDILHVNMVHYLKTPYIIMCMFFLQNLSQMNILDLCIFSFFIAHCFCDFHQ